jgi:hypothetical protein
LLPAAQTQHHQHVDKVILIMANSQSKTLLVWIVCVQPCDSAAPQVLPGWLGCFAQLCKLLLVRRHMSLYTQYLLNETLHTLGFIQIQGPTVVGDSVWIQTVLQPLEGPASRSSASRSTTKELNMALRRLGAQLGLSTQVQVAFARAFATGTLLQPQLALNGKKLR